MAAMKIMGDKFANFYRQRIHHHDFDYSSMKTAPCQSPCLKELFYLPGEDLLPKSVIKKQDILT